MTARHARAGGMLTVHGFLPPSHPLLGSFAHAPRTKNASRKFFDIVGFLSPEEHERRKVLRSNPYVGYFKSNTATWLGNRRNRGNSTNSVDGAGSRAQSRERSERKESDNYLPLESMSNTSASSSSSSSSAVVVHVEPSRGLRDKRNLSFGQLSLQIKEKPRVWKKSKSFNVQKGSLYDELMLRHSPQKRELSPGVQVQTALPLPPYGASNAAPHSPQVSSRGQNAWIIKPGPCLQDKYDVDLAKPCGRGTYSRVYRCKHKESGRDFAVKSIEKKFLFSEEEKNMARREVENQRIMNHANVIRLYDTFEDSRYLHLVVDLATAGTLEHYLQDRGAAFGLSEVEACYLVEQILRGIQHIHSLGVLHADIKPQNVLLHESKTKEASTISMLSSMKQIGREHGSLPPLSSLVVRLCDFGFSRRVPDVRYFRLTGDVHKVPPSEIGGTAGYIAPEILRGEPYGQSADIWSAGIILFELVSGMKPFSPYSDCLDHDVRFPKSVWAGKSTSLQTLLAKMLQKDPSKRISATDALAEDWFHDFQLL